MHTYNNNNNCKSSSDVRWKNGKKKWLREEKEAAKHVGNIKWYVYISTELSRNEESRAKRRKQNKTPTKCDSTQKTFIQYS